MPVLLCVSYVISGKAYDAAAGSVTTVGNIVSVSVAALISNADVYTK